MKRKGGGNTVSYNRKAGFEYFLEEKFEGGLALTGAEVKSLRAGNVSIAEAYARVEGGEVWIFGMHINPWDSGSAFKADPLRKRKVLLKSHEIARLVGKTSEKGYSIVPLRIYFKGRWAKLELALAKGKKLWDKRASIREKEAQREIDRAFRQKD